MRSSWTQPSLSRDFALLSASVLFILILISAWVTYKTYVRHGEDVMVELETDAGRIDGTLAIQMENANYMLTALGRQIAIEPEHNLVRMAQMLKSFDSKGQVYSIFSFIDPQQRVVVSSNKGVLDQPVDVSDRDYVKKAVEDPWKMEIGAPIQGRVSERWVVPVAMGLTDYTGRFVGVIQISLDISSFTGQISQLIRREGVSFAILSRGALGQTPIVLTQVSEDKNLVSRVFSEDHFAAIDVAGHPFGLLERANFFWNTGNYTYYRVSAAYPYTVLLAYDTRYSDEPIRGMLWARLLQMVTMAIFFLLLLSIIRARMIKPVLDLTAGVAAMTRGEPYMPLPRGGPAEIEGLERQIRHLSEYIGEHHRIQSELRHKAFIFKKAKEQAELQRRSKSEFLAYVCQAMRTPLNNIIGSAQIMKDQLYGPIENRKYRQYISDIYQTGNLLLERALDILTQSKAEAGYIELVEKPVDVAAVAGHALAFLSEKTQAQHIQVTLAFPERLPKLLADEFRLQQIIMNLLMYMFERVLPAYHLVLEARVVQENREQGAFAFLLRTREYPLEQAELAAIMDAPDGEAARKTSVDEVLDFNLELAKTLVGLLGGRIVLRYPADAAVTMVVLFPGDRMRPAEGNEKQ